MKHISRNLVLGSLYLSTLIFFPQTTVAADEPVTQPSKSEKTASPDGGAGNDPKKVIDSVKAWSDRIVNSGYGNCPVGVKSTLEAIKQNLAVYHEKQKDCQAREDKANKYCIESRNPNMKNYLMWAQGIMSGVSGMMDACSQFGKLMDGTTKALSAYQVACSSMRGYCNSACGSAVKALHDLEKNKEALIKEVTQQASSIAASSQDPQTKSACTQLSANFRNDVEANSEAIKAELRVDGDYKAVAQKFETCKGYAQELGVAGAGILASAVSFGTANKCSNSTDSVAGQQPVDCTIEANKKNNMTCICQDAPRTPGCNSGLDTTVAAKSGDAMRSAGGTGDYKPGSVVSVDGLTDNDGEKMDLASKGSDGSSLPGGPSGGGSGMPGSSGGFGGAPGTDHKKSSGLNTNILGGDGGGGGGGAWGGYGSDSENSALRQYLPGGAMDPAAGAMAGAAVSKQVTSQGGKSNWEKVRDRYRENKPSLLGY